MYKKMTKEEQMQVRTQQRRSAAIKECPVCHARCFADMDTCFGCLHSFANEEPFVDGLPHANDGSSHTGSSRADVDSILISGDENQPIANDRSALPGTDRSPKGSSMRELPPRRIEVSAMGNQPSKLNSTSSLVGGVQKDKTNPDKISHEEGSQAARPSATTILELAELLEIVISVRLPDRGLEKNPTFKKN